MDNRDEIIAEQAAEIARLREELSKRPEWCPTCGGSGSAKQRFGVKLSDGRGIYGLPMSCPDCDGSGLKRAAMGGEEG